MEEISREEMKNPIDYKIHLCFVFGDLDSCIEFQITADGEVENKPFLIQELINAWDGIVEIEDGCVVNLIQFKQAFVFRADEDNIPDTKKSKKLKGSNVVSIH
jgi:hypothetical protein